MPEVRLREHLYREAERRALAAGFESVDEFVAKRLEDDFSDECENFDDRFTPEVIAHLDAIADDALAGNTIAGEELDQHLAKVRTAWMKAQKS